MNPMWSVRTQDNIITSFSPPWKASTVDIWFKRREQKNNFTITVRFLVHWLVLYALFSEKSQRKWTPKTVNPIDQLLQWHHSLDARGFTWSFEHFHVICMVSRSTDYGKLLLSCLFLDSLSLTTRFTWEEMPLRGAWQSKRSQKIPGKKSLVKTPIRWVTTLKSKS